MLYVASARECADADFMLRQIDYAQQTAKKPIAEHQIAGAFVYANSCLSHISQAYDHVSYVRRAWPKETAAEVIDSINQTREKALSLVAKVENILQSTSLSEREAVNALMAKVNEIKPVCIKRRSQLLEKEYDNIEELFSYYDDNDMSEKCATVGINLYSVGREIM